MAPCVGLTIEHHVVLAWVNQRTRSPAQENPLDRSREVLSLEVEGLVDHASPKASAVARNPELAVTIADLTNPHKGHGKQAFPFADFFV